MAETMEELDLQFNSWNSAFERKGLKVNLKKTKILECGVGKGVTVQSKIDPCGVCGKRAKTNCIRCKTCQKWIHARCAKVRRVTESMYGTFECCVCILKSQNHQQRDNQTDEVNDILKDLERVDNFCYLGDTINGDGSSELSVTRRVRLGWNAFNNLSSMLCGNRYTWKLKGRIYNTCVKPVMTYGSETWVVRSMEEGILRRAERCMIRKMCGVKVNDRIYTDELMERLGLRNTIVETVRQGSMRWLGHVLRKNDDDCIKQAWNFEVEGNRGKGRPKLTWKDMMKKQCARVGAKLEDAHDQSKWRRCTNTWKESQ